jgi:hypothetical protein
MVHLVATVLVVPLMVLVVVVAAVVRPHTVAPPTPMAKHLVLPPPARRHVQSARFVAKLATVPKLVGTYRMRTLPLEQRNAGLATSFGADNSWYTNSGATDHITGDLDKLTMHDTYNGHDQIHVANGSGMDITRIGNTIIPTSTHDLVLQNVLHVPSTHKNLISIHHFTLYNDTFIEFHTYFFLIKDQKIRKLLLHNPCKGGLYPLPLSTSKF